MQKKNSLLAVGSWCLYDWACTSFSIIVTTFVFATYFTMHVAKNSIVGTYQWANATAIAGMVMAIASPLLGAIADHSGYHKIWLLFFTSLSIIFTSLLWFAYPVPSSVVFTLTCVVLATIGYEVSQVFYNVFLPTIADNKYVGRISGWGWGAGYIGGIVALTIALFAFIKPTSSWLNHATAEQIRICGPFSGLWYAVFALPMFLFVPSFTEKTMPMKQAIKLGINELASTIKKLPKEKNILLYLFAHMIYADGLNTLFAFGGIYAAGTFGLTFEEVLLFGITMNLTAGVGAIALGWLDDYLGSKRTIILSLCCLIIIGSPMLFLQHKYVFWGVALALCIFVGPVQSASRSLMVRLMANKNMAGEMFGLYALSGRITAFIGPWLLGEMTMHFDSQRAGMATIFIFLLLGCLAILRVQELSPEID
jgi:MFS transporter, UMF1 family